MSEQGVQYKTNKDSVRAMAQVLGRCAEVEAGFYFALLAGWMNANEGRFPANDKEIAEALGV